MLLTKPGEQELAVTAGWNPQAGSEGRVHVASVTVLFLLGSQMEADSM